MPPLNLRRCPRRQSPSPPPPIHALRARRPLSPPGPQHATQPRPPQRPRDRAHPEPEVPPLCLQFRQQSSSYIAAHKPACHYSSIPTPISSFLVCSSSGDCAIACRIVAHNISRRKREEIERRTRDQELRPYLVPGWTLDPLRGTFTPTKTVLGHFQRRQSVLFRCQRSDCRRRIELDLRSALDAGLGDKSMPDLLEMLRCRHWRGCDLTETSATYCDGVPLIALIGDAGTLIAIVCAKCNDRLLLPARAVIERLKKAGRGDGATGVIALGSKIRGPCRKCGGRSFKSAPIWPQHPASRPQ